MVLTVILTAVLALGVAVMVIAPLAWAIVTQHRDWPRAALRTTSADPQASRPERRRAQRPSYRTAHGRA